MKLSKEVIKSLNERAVEEMTAICQYITHAVMLKEWGYYVLRDKLMKYSIDEMHHLDGLIELILEGEGELDLELGKVEIGKNVKEIIDLLIEAEETAIEGYNDTIKIIHDEGKANHVNHFVKKYEEQEISHLEALEQQRAQIEQMGIEVYLSTLTDDE